MQNIRSKASKDMYGGSVANDYAFNQQAGAIKTLGPILGNVSILGALSAAVDSTKAGGALIAVYNNSASTAFAKTGSSSVTAPTSGADGICLPPNAYTIIALGSDTHIRCSAATCFGYLIQDDLNYNQNSGSNS
jgi:hypothetical protein